MRLAVYGGSFDPPHQAHVLAAEHVLQSGEVDRVLVVPVFRHAFHKRMEPFEHRVRMCERAFAGLDGVEVSTIEAELPAPSYTVQTLRALRRRYPDAELRFVVGTDAVQESHKWHRFDEVCRIAPLIVLGRVGVEHLGGPEPVLPDVSSTEIRAVLRERAGRAQDDPSPQLAAVPQSVLAYIDEHGLYRAEDVGSAGDGAGAGAREGEPDPGHERSPRSRSLG